MISKLLCGILLLALGAYGEMARLPESAGVGPDPRLPAPNKTLLPTVHIAPALGWPAGAMPSAAPGTRVTAFASGLEHPRWLHVLPNGDVLVAESDAPPKPEAKGLRARIMGQMMQRAGSGKPRVADDVGNTVWRVTAAAP